MSVHDKHKPLKSPGSPDNPPGGKPDPGHELVAEQAREAHEAEVARNAEASIRDRMVEIGRGNRQSGRQKS
jgi:hypothetical protein